MPVLFALALGTLLGRERWRWAGWVGVALTLTLVLMLLAQKEVGNTAVVLMIAACVFLVARGTLPRPRRNGLGWLTERVRQVMSGGGPPS